MKNFHTPERMVIAGVGMEHKTLVDLVRKYFIELKKPIWEEDPSLIDSSKHVDKSIAQYTGGDFRVIIQLHILFFKILFFFYPLLQRRIRYTGLPLFLVCLFRNKNFLNSFLSNY